MIPLKRTKILLVILVLANIVVFASYYIVFSILKDNSENTNRLSREIERELYKEEIREGMEDSLLLSDSDAQTLRDAIIKSEGEIDFIKEVEMVAFDLGLKSEIKSVKIDPIKSTTIAEEIRMSVDVIGKWSAVYNFLRRIEAFPFKIKIYKADLEKFSEEIVGSRTSILWLGQFDFGVIKLK